MMKLIVSGCSDDLVYFEGDFYDEFSVWEEPCRVEVIGEGGTITFTITYTDDGSWRIQSFVNNSAMTIFLKLLPDNWSTDVEDDFGYTDVVTIDGVQKVFAVSDSEGNVEIAVKGE